VFTRYPEPGRAKTRLIAALGPQGAARLQYRMAREALDVARSLLPGTETEVCFSGGDRRRMAALFGSDLRYRAQKGTELGERMYNALAEAVRSGSGPTVLAGTDCPGLSVDILRAAFERLADADLVLGPATDGGYYLVGIRPSCSLDKVKTLMQGMQWGTDSVLAETRRRAALMGLRTETVATLQDMDEPGDLALLPAGWGRERGPFLSVVIPALNEEGTLGSTLEGMRGAEQVETVLADGGSSDSTVAIAQDHGARIVRSERGRAGQMNAGAAASRGDVLLFLHADTVPPFLFEAFIRTGLGRPGICGGSFRFALQEDVPGGGLIAAMVNARSRVFGLPYGDQGLFCTRQAFDVLGGYPEVPILEDVHLVRGLKEQGRLLLVPETAATSARRWRRLGPLRTTLINQAIMAGYLLGVKERSLARLYRQ
jgi:rSAM/selenodomain-associated transferase 2/rSAM/selenodomain-associated transferase 1